MARKKSDKTVKSINFDDIVLERLLIYCRKANLPISTFVNNLTRKHVMNECDFAREMTKHHCSEMHRWKQEAEFLEVKE